MAANPKPATAPPKEQINILQWESSITLGDSQSAFLKELEIYCSNMSAKALKGADLSLSEEKATESRAEAQRLGKDEEREELIQSLSSAIQVKQDEDRSLGDLLAELNHTKLQNGQISNLLENILRYLENFKANFDELQVIKASLIEKINQFYNESSRIITQQKNLLELITLIQSNLLYYTEVQRLEKEIDQITVNLATREHFESKLQRFLSEIIDGILFFESNISYRNQKQFLEHYTKLKKKLLVLIKSFYFKIFNRQSNEMNTTLGKIKIPDVFYAYDHFITLRRGEEEETTCLKPAEGNRLALLITLFPDLLMFFLDDRRSATDKESSAASVVQETLDRGLGLRAETMINDCLRNLLVYLYNSSKRDSEISEILSDIFDSYFPYYRTSTHTSLLEKMGKLASGKLRLKDIIQKIFFISLELNLHEYIYYLFLFNFNLDVEREKVKSFTLQTLDKHYEFVRPLIIKETNLESVFESIDEVNKLIACFESILKDYFVLPSFKDAFAKGRISEKSREYILGSFSDIFKDYLLKSKQDLMQKLIHLVQIYIQENIVNYDLKTYMKSSSRKIPKYSHEEIKKASQMSPVFIHYRDEVFPVIKSTISLLNNLKGRIEPSVLKQMACEVITSSLNMLYTSAEIFEEKFDSFLFLLKHLLLLNGVLSEIGVDFLVKETQLDFSETKSTFYELISGNINTEISFQNLNKENIWQYTSSLINFIYKGMPKVNEFTIDLKQNIQQQITNINCRFLKDMSFIISKNICDFIRRHNHLSDMLEKERTNLEKIAKDEAEITDEKERKTQEPLLKKARKSAEDAISKVEKDMSTLLLKENVKKNYILFMESLSDTHEEMVGKMNNFLHEDLFLEVSQYIESIVENVLLLLHQFYIIVAEKYEEEAEYAQFNFAKIENVRKDLNSKVQFFSL